jgi:SprT-like family protein
MRKRISKTKALQQKVSRKQSEPVAITLAEYGGLQAAYDHLNKELFGGELPDVMLTLQRKNRSGGYFAPDRFSGRSGKFVRHELALNPDGFIGQTDRWVVSVLGHEMHHVWEHGVKGTPSRGYHSKEWAAKMKLNGLQPSNTGMVGGKETGQRMSDYIIPGGVFEQAFAALAATGWALNLQSAHHGGGKGTPNSKVKFTCRLCGQNAWGKPDLSIICALCNKPMLDATATTTDAVIASYHLAAE